MLGCFGNGKWRGMRFGAGMLCLLLGGMSCGVDPEHRRPEAQAQLLDAAPNKAPEYDATEAPAPQHNAEEDWSGVPMDNNQEVPNEPEAPAQTAASSPNSQQETAQVETMHTASTPEDSGLSPEATNTLLAHSWMDRVVSGLGVWVCIDTQMLYVLEGLEPVWQTRIATAAAGAGAIANSYQTPLGWHNVSEKFGDDAPWGQVFRARAATREIWQPGDDTEEDLVLTRILWLDGEEPGKNQGYNEAGQLVDSKRRYIYIHGTNGEHVIGTPSSHGCIRMYNDDVIALYDMLPLGTPVLITETS